jgi:hypothetical protein
MEQGLYRGRGLVKASDPQPESAPPPPSGVTEGRIVHYIVGEYDLAQIRQLGGNQPQPGDELAAVIVRVWDAAAGYVNLKVFLDGPRDYWATSRKHYDLPEDVKNSVQPFAVEQTWHFPHRG